jgi:hypothetical protein
MWLPAVSVRRSGRIEVIEMRGSFIDGRCSCIDGRPVPAIAGSSLGCLADEASGILSLANMPPSRGCERMSINGLYFLSSERSGRRQFRQEEVGDTNASLPGRTG